MNIVLQGYGKMGKNVEAALADYPDMRIAGVVHPGLFVRPQDVPGKIDVLIDFSYPGNLENALVFAKERGCALIIGTTGLTDAQLAAIKSAAEYAPVMYSANYSLGVAAMKRAVRLLSEILLPAGFDAEIIEKHHSAKLDAPSGTAKSLAEAVDPSSALRRVYAREGFTGARGAELGIHSLRGGTNPGEHSVIFMGGDEEIEIKHAAQSRMIFARGAVRAARALCGADNGFYTMDDIIDIINPIL